MRLPRRRRKEVTSSIGAAVRAREDANEQLVKARDVIATQSERARAEHATVIEALRRMRQSNNLARMILDSVEKDVTGTPGQS